MKRTVHQQDWEPCFFQLVEFTVWTFVYLLLLLSVLVAVIKDLTDQMLVWLEQWFKKFQKVNGQLHCDVMLNRNIWLLISTLTQELNGRLWTYFTFCSNILNWRHWSWVPLLKLWWLCRSGLNFGSKGWDASPLMIHYIYQFFFPPQIIKYNMEAHSLQCDKDNWIL